MPHVTSKDGTSIAYERGGQGPAVVLVGGALDDGAENAPLAAELATRFTVFNYARRGRGSSGDTPPYAVEREIEDLEALIAEGRRGEALELFMRRVGSPDEVIAEARQSPFWPGLEAIAHTLAYDAACVGDGPPPAARLATITRPALVATGGPRSDPYASGQPADFFDRAADAIAAAVPGAERQTFAGQGHVGDPALVASRLEGFFTG